MLHHHHHHQVQIIATVVRLEAIGAVFGVIGFGVGCYLFVVVWSFRFEDGCDNHDHDMIMMIMIIIIIIMIIMAATSSLLFGHSGLGMIMILMTMIVPVFPSTQFDNLSSERHFQNCCCSCS